MIKLRAVIGDAVPFLSGIGRRRIATYAAAGTFFFFLSLAPIIMIMCFVIPRTFLSEEILLTVAYSAVPESVFPFVRGLIGNIYAGQGMSLSLSIIVTAWSASLSMAALMRGLSAAYDVERSEGFLHFRLKAIFYMVVLLVSAVILLCAIVFGHQLILLGLSYFKSEGSWRRALIIMKYGRYFMMFVFLALVFLIIYRFASGSKLKIWQHMRGAVFTSAAWLLFSAVFSYWVTNFTSLGIFGFLGTVIIAMLWLYYCLLFLLIGGYINSRRSEQ